MEAGMAKKILFTNLEIDILLKMIDEGYSKSAWHGANLRGSLRGVDAKKALWRPGKGRPRIWDIVVHLAHSKYLTWRRTVGDKAEKFPRESTGRQYWYEIPSIANEANWRKDLKLLNNYHKRVREAIAALKKQPIEQPFDTVLHRINGCAMHDVYHAGQIQLIKKLCGKG
jgi:hypothetical protein